MWSTDIIYTLPDSEMINVCKHTPAFEQCLYYIPEIPGIPGEQGLLAIKPAIDQSTRKMAIASLANKVSHSYLPEVEINAEQKEILDLLKLMQPFVQIPVMYYRCFLSGGTFDQEFSIVFGNDYTDVLVRKDSPFSDVVLHERNGIVQETDQNPLIDGMRHLGVYMPDGYLPLHVSTFDWEAYRLRLD